MNISENSCHASLGTKLVLNYMFLVKETET